MATPRIRLIVLVAGLLSAAASVGQSIPANVASGAAALRDRALDGELAWEIVESLTMEVGPRPAGSAADRAAVAWAVDTMTRLGFSNVHTDAVDVPHWDRGTLELRMTAPYAQPLVATSLGGSPGTPETGIEAPVVRVESLAALLELTQAELEGRIAYVDHVMERDRSGSGYGVSSVIRACAHVAAAERGALATVIRSAGTSRHRFAHTGGMLIGGAPAKIPGIALSNADADILTHAVNTGEQVSVRLLSTARDLPPTQSANVVGEVPGSGELADEIVILAAHLDSWDLGTGAIDDASGVGIVLAAAKLIMDSGERPRRTVRVVLYAAEEIGIYGGRQYAEAHADSIPRHVVGLEADFGPGRVWRFSSRVAEEALGLVDELHALLAPLGIERGDNEGFGGADLGPLQRQGMPVFDLSQDGTTYFDYHHTADDTLDKVDRDDLNQNVAAYVTAAFVAANIEGDFGRLPVTTGQRSCPK
ncbi:MAG: M20/M25/M40 family metallo-hydrolase [Gammaproteobacteria bacterium]|nr:M20/M25/M40 family metallo-hydrolase [Gammaproteobacteria bacterium]MDH4255403.1 M20/M25/M40 family metallo-hydrolase [Gammaproteobacteria bacterium]MDH5312082.1 M20/M25/M40 family metallo-hydrolase [Gammaproteobacteria bacterium]